MKPENIPFTIPSGAKLSAVLQRPRVCRGLFVLGHGSGSNMHVPLISGLSDAPFAKGIATLRFQYPYSESPDFVPFSDMPVDCDTILIETIRSAIVLAKRHMADVPVLVGGHSTSGYATTLADAEAGLQANAIIALGYPRQGDPARSNHLSQTNLPILVIQGTEDTLGTASEIEDMVRPFQPRIQLRWIERGSHVFTVAGLDQSKVLKETADHISNFVQNL